jgi:hypothetical protein
MYTYNPLEDYYGGLYDIPTDVYPPATSYARYGAQAMGDAEAMGSGTFGILDKLKLQGGLGWENFKNMGTLGQLGTAGAMAQTGYDLFTPNTDLYWGPRAMGGAMTGAMAGAPFGPIGMGVGAVTGYMGGKF